MKRVLFILFTIIFTQFLFAEATYKEFLLNDIPTLKYVEKKSEKIFSSENQLLQETTFDNLGNKIYIMCYYYDDNNLLIKQGDHFQTTDYFYKKGKLIKKIKNENFSKRKTIEKSFYLFSFLKITRTISYSDSKKYFSVIDFSFYKKH